MSVFDRAGGGGGGEQVGKVVGPSSMFSIGAAAAFFLSAADWKGDAKVALNLDLVAAAGAAVGTISFLGSEEKRSGGGGAGPVLRSEPE